MNSVKKEEKIKGRELVVKVLSVPDWAKVKTGMIFQGIKNGEKVSGKILVAPNEEIFFCSNCKRLEGASAPHRLGYKYSYSMGPREDLIKEPLYICIKKLKIFANPGFKSPKMPIIIAGRTVVFDKNKLVVGCTMVPYPTVEEIYKTAVKKKFIEK